MEWTTNNQEATSTTRRALYENSLRRLGAWLDSVAARSITVRERPDGFVVRYYRQDIDTVFIQRFFTNTEMETLQRSDLRVRRSLVRRVGHNLQGMTAESGGYQDIFRALGHVLDEADSHDICLVEEEETGNLVVMQSDPEGSETLRRISLDEREQLREVALARRQGEA